METLQAVIPRLFVKNATEALAFYKSAFGATETMNLLPKGPAEIMVGGSRIMVDEESATERKGPRTLGGSSVLIHLHVDDVDTVFRRTIAAGATVLQPVKDQFFGLRCGELEDPFGHCWLIATRTETLSPAEIQKRIDAREKR
ncbi:MAG: VOC family protein [Candidatus Binataceae bacterium]